MTCGCPGISGAIQCSVWYGEVYGVRCFFIEPHSQDNFFNRGRFYGCTDEVRRFAFFSKAALEFLLKSNRRPDIIHCHDWQTGIVPVLLFEMYNHSGCGTSGSATPSTISSTRASPVKMYCGLSVWAVRIPLHAL